MARFRAARKGLDVTDTWCHDGDPENVRRLADRLVGALAGIASESYHELNLDMTAREMVSRGDANFTLTEIGTCVLVLETLAARAKGKRA